MPMNFAAQRRRSQMGRRNNSGGFRQAFTPPPSLPTPTPGNAPGLEGVNRTMPFNPINATPPARVMPPVTEAPMMSSPGGMNVATPATKANFNAAPQPPPTEGPAYGIPTQVPEMDPNRRRLMTPQ